MADAHLTATGNYVNAAPGVLLVQIVPGDLKRAEKARIYRCPSEDLLTIVSDPQNIPSVGFT